MVPWTGLRSRRAGSGFTLVELLLAISLLLMLVGAVVFSFSTLLNGTRLEEGAGQLESLIRFARAQAANSGRKVQLVFDSETSGVSSSAAAGLRLTWEADPLGQPGVFQSMDEALWQAEAVNGLIQIQSVQLLEAGWEQTTATEPGLSVDVGDDLAADPLTPITFYPDGSSDSAEIILSSRVAEEEQQMSVRIEGLSGSIRRQLIRVESAEVPDDMDGISPAPVKAGERAKPPVTAPAPAARPMSF